ncbi:CHAT domain-containing protein [Winogradskyella haliclonae]|uniref:CHAT domain-containing protein n=1 Tax=Winogradskyella haliclonae TaxID=2048558 RepID=A0ABQ2BU71_9FLAO|nr:CHAT domain-containing protein [Winogradskyella haliclonae]GGI55990.1 hypothetical protein GCM10011444_02990 [Winogradskyella haliclonae]
MKNLFVLFFVSSFSVCFSQTLEERIYASTEQFYSEPNLKNLQILNSEIKIYEPQLRTEDEYFAFINLIVNKAYYLGEQNKQREAISAYEKAHQIYIKNNVASYDIVEYCLIPLGILYHKTNAYLKAENIIKHYIVIAKKQNNKTQQITGSINLAGLYQSLNRHQSVINIIDKTLQIDGIKKQQKQRLNSLKRRSQLLLETNQEKLLLDGDIVFSIKEDFETLQLKYQLNLKNEDYNKAFSYFNRIKNNTLKNKLTSSRALAKLSFQEAQLYYLINKPDKALQELKNTLAILLPKFKDLQHLNETNLYPENTFLDVFDLLAEMEANPEKKLSYHNLGIYVANLLDYESSSEESLIVKANANRNRSEKCIGILHQLYLKDRDSIFLQQAINYAEQHKVSILKNRSERRNRIQKYGDSDSTLIKENLLLKEQRQLTNRLLNRPANKNLINAQDSIRLRLIKINNELKFLQDLIKQNYSIESTKAITLKDIYTKLKAENTTIVEYFYGKNAIYQFVFSEKNHAFNKIPIHQNTTQDIINFISYFNDATKINSDVAAYTEDAFSIYNLLKFNAVSDQPNVIIIPDGWINFIPFETLLYTKTTSTIFSKMPFVVNNQSLAYNSSLLFYLNDNKERLEDNLLGIFPVFKDSNQELLHTINEAKSIETQIPSKLLMHQLATKESFIKKASDYSILHLSTHATSGDFVNPATISFSNTILSLNELYNLNLNPNLVVLSACETGIGKLVKGEGTMSIASGFQYAGAKNILFSLWQINDLSTSEIMSSFYRYYGNGKSAVFSNTQSKIDYLSNNTISNAKKSPYYWGAFTYYGDSQELKSAKSIVLLWSLGVLALLIIVFLMFKYYYKNANGT